MFAEEGDVWMRKEALRECHINWKEMQIVWTF